MTADTIYWTGAASGAWNTAATNWKLTGNKNNTRFMPNDAVLFHDNPTRTTVDINDANVSPISTTFDNSTATEYTVQSSGTYGIATGPLTKNNNGTVILTNPNTTPGPVALNGGTVVLWYGDSLGTGPIILGDANTGDQPVALSFQGLTSNTAIGPITVANQGTGTTIYATVNAANNNQMPQVPTLTLGKQVILRPGEAAPGGRTTDLWFDSITGPGAGAGADSIIVEDGGATVRTSISDSGAAYNFAGNVRVASGTWQMQNRSYIAYTPENNNLIVPDTSRVTVDAGANWNFAHTMSETIAALDGAGRVYNGYSQQLCTLTVGFGDASGDFSGATGSLVTEINSTALTADRLAVTGNLDIAPAASLTLTDTGAGTPAVAKLVIVTYSGTWNGTPFAGKPDDSPVTVGANTYTINYNDTDGGLNAVTLRISSADPYDAWASSYDLTGDDALKTADPDGDGIDSLLEFATASDPTDGSSGPRIYPLVHPIGPDNALTVTLAVRKDAAFGPAASPDEMNQTATKDLVIYTVEASDDLAVWNVVEVTEVTGTDATTVQGALGTRLTTPPLDAAWEWHTFRTADGANVDPMDFIRLKVAAATP